MKTLVCLAVLFGAAKLFCNPLPESNVAAAAVSLLQDVARPNVTVNDVKFVVESIHRSPVGEYQSVKEAIADLLGRRGISADLGVVDANDSESRETTSNVPSTIERPICAESLLRERSRLCFELPSTRHLIQQELDVLSKGASRIPLDERLARIERNLQRLVVAEPIDRHVIRLRFLAVSLIAPIDPDRALRELHSMSVTLDYVAKALPIFVAEGESDASADGQPSLETLSRFLGAELRECTQGFQFLARSRFDGLLREIDGIGYERLRMVLRLGVITSVR